MPTINVSPAANADDASVFSNGTNFANNATALLLGHAGAASRYSAVRFPAVAIGNGATITAATVGFVGAANSADTTVNVTIYGHDVDNAGQFNAASDMTGVSLTSASVAWSNIGAMTSGSTTNATTPDITSIIQEIVNRPGWSSGNAIAIQFRDNGSTANTFRQVAAYDHASLAEPVLSITFTVTTQDVDVTLHTNTQTFYGITVEPGEVTRSVGLLTNTQTFYPMTAGDFGAINVSIATGSDDGWWLSGGSFNNTAVSIPFGPDLSDSFNAFVRFELNIPPGAVVLSASMQMVADFSSVGTAVNILIAGVDEDDAAAPTSRTDAEGRSLTTATVEWNNVPAFTAGNTYNTPDIASIIQELVDRPGWQAGNAALIYLLENSSTAFASRYVAAYENTNYDPMLLTVVFAEPIVADVGLLTNQQTFYEIDAVPGPVTVEPSLFTNQQAFYDITAKAVVALSALLENDQTFYSVTATPGEVVIAPTLFTNQQAFYSPTIVPGAVSRALGALLVNQQTFYALFFAGELPDTVGGIEPMLAGNGKLLLAMEAGDGSAVATLAAGSGKGGAALLAQGGKQIPAMQARNGKQAG